MSKRILVVEDQPNNRQIDLILMDIQLPIMDAYEGTRQIKAHPALQSIPSIAVTSYALSGEEKKARAAGCDDYVPKTLQPTSTIDENQAIPVLRLALIAAVPSVSSWHFCDISVRA